MSAENLAYAGVQLVHNFGAVAVVGGAAAGRWLAPGDAGAHRRLAWLVLAGWAAQAASGALFGAVSLYYYGALPDIHGVAVAALRIKVAAAVVGGDTGPLHLARVLGRPVVGLFHAADPARTGPAGLPGAAPVRVLRGEVTCAPCCAARCARPDGRRVCLEALTPARVVDALFDLLG